MINHTEVIFDTDINKPQPALVITKYDLLRSQHIHLTALSTLMR